MAQILIPLEILIPIGLVIMILITITWVLYTKNKRIFTKLESEKKKASYFKEKIKNIEEFPSKNHLEDFEKLNNLARDYFKEYYNLGYNLTYLELKEEFLKLNKSDFAGFCQKMSDINYSGEKAQEYEIKNLIDKFADIVG